MPINIDKIIKNSKFKVNKVTLGWAEKIFIHLLLNKKGMKTKNFWSWGPILIGSTLSFLLFLMMVIITMFEDVRFPITENWQLMLLVLFATAISFIEIFARKEEMETFHLTNMKRPVSFRAFSVYAGIISLILFILGEKLILDCPNYLCMQESYDTGLFGRDFCRPRLNWLPISFAISFALAMLSRLIFELIFCFQIIRKFKSS